MSGFRKDQVKDMYGLSPMQEGMLFHTALGGGESRAYIEQMTMTAAGHVDVQVLERSMSMIVERYDVFRTVFLYEKLKKPIQVVLREREFRIAYEDLSELDRMELRERIEAIRTADVEKGFDLTRELPMRMTVLRTGSERYVLIWSHHHIVMDGWCLSLIMGELFAIYPALKSGLPVQLPPVEPYSRYMEWLQKQNREAALAYWRDAMSGIADRTSLPRKIRNGTESTLNMQVPYEKAETSLVFDRALTQSLTDLAARLQVTLNSLVQGLWGVLLQAYNHSEEAVFGTVVSGRPPEVPGVEAMIGLFINTVPVRVQVQAARSFAELVQELQRQAAAAEPHHFVPLYEIQGVTELRQNLFDHILVFENYPVDQNVRDSGTDNRLGFEVEHVEVVEETSYSLNVMVIPGAELNFKFNYNGNVIEAALLERVKEQLLKLAQSAAANPEAAPASLELLTEKETLQLRQWNKMDDSGQSSAMTPTSIQASGPATIHEWFENQVELVPNRTAVVFGQERLSYRKLNAKANRLARFLREKGVGSDCPVALMTERCPEFVVGVLGILKAGGAVVPVDPDYPADRVAYMLSNSGANILLTARLKEGQADAALKGTNAVTFDLLAEASYAENGSNLPPVNKASDLLYVIYTSGTTGKPKGVMLEHGNLVNLLQFQERYSGIGFDGKVLQYTTISFDVCYQELFSTLLAGGELHLIDNDTKRSVEKLTRYIGDQEIPVLFLPVSFVKFIFSDPDYAGRMPACIRHVITAGEQLVVSDGLKTFIRERGVQLHNHYGPSETHVVTTWTMGPGDEDIPELPPIGRPVSNTRMYLLNGQKRLAPVGAVGELFIAGVQVGRGYINNEGLTAERFTSDPFVPGERMYRTGDLARWLPDGSLEYLGRTDHQVKIRGHRVELGEIESRMLNHPQVTAAAVLDREDSSGTKYLCGYYAAAEELESDALRSYLADGLPEYLLPAFLMQLPALPLTPNGKTDRRALPLPDVAAWSGTAPYKAPENPVEKVLVRLWSEVLGMPAERIGVEESFFALGGHSLKAMSLISRINKHFDADVPLRTLFQTPTIRALALAVRRAGDAESTLIPAAPLQETYPVSFAQRRMYVMSRLEGSGTAYHLPGAFLIEGSLDEERFEQAFRGLIQRHAALRTSFHMSGGVPVQRIHTEVDFRLERIPTKDFVSPEAVMESFIRPFDLGVAPLLRAGTAWLSGDRFLFVYDMHHIISDGVSMGLIVEELSQLYNGGELPGLRIQYHDFSVWQNANLHNGELKAQEDYWLNQFAVPAEPLELPSDFPRPPTIGFEGNTVSCSFGPDIARSVARLAAEHGATPFMVLLAAYYALLSNYSGGEDIVIGTPAAARPHEDTEGVVGMFVNMLALRIRTGKAVTFSELLKEVKRVSLSAYENQDYPFDMLVEKLGSQRETSRHPIFDTLFAVQSLDSGRKGMEGLSFKPVTTPNRTAKFDLSFEARTREDDLALSVEYSTRLFREDTVERMIGHYRTLLTEACRRPQARISELSMLTDMEKEQILLRFNDTYSYYPSNAILAGLFLEQCILLADGSGDGDAVRPAAVMNGRTLSYRELAKRSERISSALFDYGIGPDSAVGLLAERSLEHAAGAIGALMAGAGYVPLDPDLPEERLRFILQDSGARVVLVQPGWEELAGQVCAADTVLLRIDLNEELHENGVPDYASMLERLHAVGPDHLAYIMYTSGSTGAPKGVMVTQRNVVRLVKNSTFVPWEEVKAFLQTGAVGFDAITFELFGALLNGAAVHFTGKDTILHAGRMKQYILEHGITTMWLTSPLFNQLSQEEPDMFRTLRHLLVGGEALSPLHINRVRRSSPGLKLINGYGPTENTTFSACFTVDKDYEDQIPIGRPISNSTAYILNGSGGLLPVGVPGELCVGGDGVARGYAGLEEQTRERFVPDPYRTGGTMYRTGDLAKWQPDGTLLYLGRIDQQVKIRGYRIELGEIEGALLKQEGVEEAAAVAVAGPSGDKALCIYYTGDAERSAVRERLQRVLPSYMVPDYVIQLKRMPLTANGKLNRKSLPAPHEGDRIGTAYEPPADDVEEALCAMWQEHLVVARVGVTDDFFALGGHSLKAMALLEAMKQAFCADLSIRLLFEHPTVRQLAHVLKSRATYTFGRIEAASAAPHYPLSPAQRRMYIMAQRKEIGTSYNIPGILVVKGRPDAGRFQRIFESLIRRHESLRTSFRQVHGMPVQVISEQVPFHMETGIAAPGETAEAIAARFIRPFELQQAPLMRAALVTLDAERHLLMLDMHHIISDGVSMGVLVKEFAELYEGASELPAARIHYKDYAVWLNELLDGDEGRKQEQFWLELYKDGVPPLELPTDYPRSPATGFAGSLVERSLEPKLAAALRSMAGSEEATLYMVLLSGLMALLNRYTGREELVVGTPVSGRPHDDVRQMIGMFVGTLALRGHLHTNQSFRELLSDVKKHVLDAFEHQLYPLEALVEKLDISNETGRNPLFDVMFSLQNMELPHVKLEGLEFEPYLPEQKTAQFELSFKVAEGADRELSVCLEYSTELFRRETAERMLTDYIEVLRFFSEEPDAQLGKLELMRTELVTTIQLEPVEFNL